MKEKGAIVVIGSSNTDMIVKAGHLPLPGETVLGGQFFTAQGGKGANQAVAAARLGGQVTFVAKVGEDQFGDAAIENYLKDGINTQYVTKSPDAASGVALILVDGKGENSIAVASGANAELSEKDIDEAGEIIRSAAIVLMQLESPMDTVLYAARMAYESGAKVILNPAPAASIPMELYRYLYAVTPNETESELLTGVKVTDENSALKASEVFIGRGVRRVVITMGSKGAFVNDGDKSYMVSARKVKAVDTTAAGDTYNGAMCVALAEGKTLRESLEFATKASAIAVTRMGAQPSIPTREEVDSTI